MKPGPAWRRQVIVMVKLPRPGRVKTRLGREIGMGAAAWWSRHQLRELLRRIDDPRWSLALAVSPDAEGLAARVWPAHLPRLAQGGGDLGARMERLLRQGPPGPRVIVGADIPGLGAGHIARAFRALAYHDAAIGPAPDGGYWLIGAKRLRPLPLGVFDGVRWSTDSARADTLARLERAGVSRVARLDWLADVDTAEDLRAAFGQRQA